MREKIKNEIVRNHQNLMQIAMNDIGQELLPKPRSINVSPCTSSNLEICLHFYAPEPDLMQHNISLQTCQLLQSCVKVGGKASKWSRLHAATVKAWVTSLTYFCSTPWSCRPTPARYRARRFIKQGDHEENISFIMVWL